MNKRIKLAASTFLLEDLNAIPLRVRDPNDHQIVHFQDVVDAGNLVEQLEWEAGPPVE